MILMQLKNILKQFSGETLFHNVNFEVQDHDRIALVGKNGVGKSTLLKIMIETIGYDAGEIFKGKHLSMGYLSQHHALDSSLTVKEEMMTVFANLISEEKSLHLLAEKIEYLSELGEYDENLALEYAERQEQFSTAGGYRYESDIRGVLLGLGFSETDFTRSVNDLSGGQKTRINLGKLLLQAPQLLILDEPTNHLDIATMTWLENYLANYPGALVIVSHDRYFLDKIVGTVYEIANHQTKKYHGTYTDYLKQKALNFEQDLKTYEKQQAEIKDMEEFVAKNLVRASTTKRAQSKRKQLEKLVRLEKPFAGTKAANFSFKIKRASGKDVLAVDNLSFKYADSDLPLFKNISFDIYRHERIALIGENGIGKTTLLKQIRHDSPTIKLGANVEIGYYDQEQATLEPKNTLLEEVWQDFPEEDEQTIRTTLGHFLFSGEDVEKQVHSLSGGEKARVALAKLMLKQANFLLLDEPTNHLDLESKEVLENALVSFPGTILFVSHDRYFINKLTDRVFELEKDGIHTYLGNYDYYIEKKTEQAEIKKLEENTAVTPIEKSVSTQQLSFEAQKKQQSEARKKQRMIEKLEREIDTLEDTIDQLEQEMVDPVNLQDHEKLTSLSKQVDTLRSELENKMETWAALQE